MSGGFSYDGLVLAALPGQVSWILWIDNRIHATAWNYRLIKVVGMSLKLLIVGTSLAGLAWWGGRTIGSPYAVDLPPWLQTYVAACALNTLVSTLPWLLRGVTARDADVLLDDRAERVDLRPALGSPPDIRPIARAVAALPGNQYLSLAVHEKRLLVPRLPAALEGLRIVQLSDLHLTGRVGKSFYERIVELANAADPDLIVLTGDLLEKEVCWDWIPDTFGRLQARHGTYFIFGNHDVRIDLGETQRRLEAAGLIALGGRCVRNSIRGVDVVQVGNERPWIPDDFDPAQLPPRDGKPQFRLLLSHSPDEYAWARRHDFDLMLAGHVHGGQIRIPPIGPILAPSRFGVRYASGVFYEPPTVLHVSRGSSSKSPLRFFCPPELTTLILTGPG